jgi:hypothetical protein
VDYDVLGSVTQQVKVLFFGRTIRRPKIAAGLAKGDWTTNAGIIDQELAGENHTPVKYGRSWEPTFQQTQEPCDDGRRIGT